MENRQTITTFNKFLITGTHTDQNVKANVQFTEVLRQFNKKTKKQNKIKTSISIPLHWLSVKARLMYKKLSTVSYESKGRPHARH